MGYFEFPGLEPAGNILGQFGYMGLGGATIINVSGVAQDYPDNTDLGSDFNLLWYDSELSAPIGGSSMPCQQPASKFKVAHYPDPRSVCRRTVLSVTIACPVTFSRNYRPR